MGARKIPEAIQWSEGMLLTPQHFQQSSLRQEALVQYSALTIQPYLWGVRHLVFDDNVLLSGVLRVLKLEAIMPDGLAVSHDASSGETLEINLIPAKDELKSKPATIYLAVRKRGDTAVDGNAARYQSVQGDPVKDENTGKGTALIARLRPRLNLVMSETEPQDCDSFPLATVQFKDEVFSLGDYIPPTTAVSLDSPLGLLCLELAKMLREKATALSDQVQSPSAPGSMPLIIENKRKIQCLVAGLPMFESILYTSKSHPFPLYLALSSMAGHLAALGSSLMTPVFKPYDHNHLRATYEQVREFALRMVSEGISETYMGFPFQFSKGVFELSFDLDWAGRRLILAVRGQAGMSDEDLRKWGEECLIGSSSVIQSLRDRRILGASRENIAEEEDLIPPRGVIFFLLKFDPDFIKPDETLQIVTVSERARKLRPAEIVLHVRKAQR